MAVDEQGAVLCCDGQSSHSDSGIANGVQDATTASNPCCQTSCAKGGGIPPPALEGTKWSLLLDIGRTTFTFMPLNWATDGMRLELPVAVEFRPGGELAVIGVGSFLGSWFAPDNPGGLVEFMPALQAMLPRPPQVQVRPTVSNGKWRIVPDQEDGRLVEFFIETNGFRRGVIWLPPGKLRFRAKAYGQLLAPGTDPVVTIRESRSVFGAIFGAFSGATMGPMSLVACAAAGAYGLRRVGIVVGRWSFTRLEEEELS
eukprot:CAMPEP_0172900318 /NCGR_PEP_ID=MMETSP1075-20121228/163797_1 /TAXON_ID=2916 /ORGANISM="Ceratium fusus, Strain PA161109" /LENGTH=256 /DNA_ID=CAMNT_0013756469 /DNA_START=52 /DNA_END=819 /DNA_ORIENTATION=-